MLGDKKVLFSGMQATGNLTLGNYLGPGRERADRKGGKSGDYDPVYPCAGV